MIFNRHGNLVEVSFLILCRRLSTDFMNHQLNVQFINQGENNESNDIFYYTGIFDMC